MKPPKHTIQWIAPHLSGIELVAIYQLVQSKIIGKDEIQAPGSVTFDQQRRNKIRKVQRTALATLFGMDNK